MPTSLDLRAPRLLSLAALALSVAALALLGGCAGAREQRSHLAWDQAWRAFDTTRDDVAPLGSEATLQDYVDLALARNPRLQAEAHEWRAGLERVPQMRALPDPRVTYMGDVGGNMIETRLGPQEHRVSLTQAVPWPGKLHYGAEMALEEAEAARARVEVARWDLIAQVTEAYAEYYVLARELEITRGMLDLIRHWEGVARVRLRAGVSAAYQDAIKAQVEMGRLEERVASFEDLRGARVARLQALLDLPATTQLPWPRGLPDRVLALPPEAVRGLVGRESPLLAEAEQMVAARAAAVNLARQSYFPDLSFGIDYVAIGEAINPNVRGSGDDVLMYGVGLSLPIWFGRYGAATAEARARHAAAVLRRGEVENALEARLERALFAYRDAERKTALYRDSLLPKAEQSLQVITGAYEAGGANFLDLLDAERILLEFRLAVERAVAARQTALAELEAIVGAELGAPRLEGSR